MSGTVTIDVDVCKGCELCIGACPPRVLTMSQPVNGLGYRYPDLAPGCTGCAACQLICPDFVFEVFRAPREQPNKSGAERARARSRSDSGAWSERPGPQGQERDGSRAERARDGSRSDSGTWPERPGPQGQERE